MKPELDHLFVYGTLRRGFGLHRVLKQLDAQFAGGGSIQARLYNLKDFPGALPSSVGDHRVAGEIYKLKDPDSQLKILDQEEEFYPDSPRKSLFVRKVTKVRLRNGLTREAWVYFLNKKPAGARPISRGNYTSVQEGRARAHARNR
jgi:gamma-glutamylcyclotransferase (GGCT)/AIG2-like uncharacterized protein YtfP